MISGKHIEKISIILIVAAIVGIVLLMANSHLFSEKIVNETYSVEYKNELFDTDKIITVDILMDSSEWRSMLDNAMSEQYIKCDVTINGKTFYSVGIRPKGNTSLSSVASDPDNDRYSFKLEFDQFVDEQTCFGLDKLVLNNNYADTTAMKEAIIYDMFGYLGADASLYNFAKISVNGEYFGTYLALEAVEESFMLRNYGLSLGYLYKPDSMNMGARKEGEGMGGFGRGGGSNLNYTGDSLDNYTTIWNSQVNESDNDDHKRIVTALKNINSGTDIEKYFDVDNIIKYMAVHSFAVNDDSLSGGMAHNYYLYESGEKINIIPWDYNLSLGGMRSSDATGIVNTAIDDSYSSTTLFDAILKNEEYLERYHEVYRKLIEEYFDGGIFDETYERIRNQIDTLIETDPNSMYSYEQYLEGTDTLYNLIKLRVESIRGQLDGSIPSTSALQREDSSSLINADGINISDMGQFMGGGRGPSDRNKTSSQQDSAQKNTDKGEISQ